MAAATRVKAFFRFGVYQPAGRLLRTAKDAVADHTLREEI